MAKKAAFKAHLSTSQSAGRLLDVTVVLLEHGYVSTAIAPIEIFHSAGVVWNWLNGEAETPRFRVRTASVDGRKVRAAGSLVLTPDCTIKDIKHTDIIIVAAPGWDELDRIAKGTPLVPWLRRYLPPALPQGSLADRAIRDGGRPDFLQRRCLRLDRSKPLFG
jgi:transcriptional regulator GlxA family with amidase domain